MRLIHTEEILAGDATAFIPRVQEEETKPTFEHPEDWDSLSLQGKAHLILADKAVKLMRLLCQEKVTRRQEREISTGQISITPPGMPEMTGRVGGGREEQAYISQTPRDLIVSSPRTVGETGGLSRFPTNGGKVKEHPADREEDPMAAKSEETFAYEELLKIVKSSPIVEVEKEMGKNNTSGKDNSVFGKAEETLACEDITNIATSDDESEE